MLWHTLSLFVFCINASHCCFMHFFSWAILTRVKPLSLIAMTSSLSVMQSPSFVIISFLFLRLFLRASSCSPYLYKKIFLFNTKMFFSFWFILIIEQVPSKTQLLSLYSRIGGVNEGLRELSASSLEDLLFSISQPFFYLASICEAKN